MNLHNFSFALDAIKRNKIRTILTTLGIIFGVAAVISMLAIGNGAKQDILDMMKLVGVNNIIITPRNTSEEDTDKSNNTENDESLHKFSKGLRMDDARSIKKILPTINNVCSEITINTNAIHNYQQQQVSLTGVSPSYFSLFHLKLRKGNFFSEYMNQQGKPVCVIGSSVAARLFPQSDPLNKYIKCKGRWLQVIGILDPLNVSGSALQNLNVNNSDNAVFCPINTFIMRYREQAGTQSDGTGGQSTGSRQTYHQLHKIIVQVSETESLKPTTEIINRMLLRRHSQVRDFKITVPELLLKQQQESKNIFNIILSSIAGISLLVGGIGIMNIMFVSVLERLREIGIRLSFGASKQDITTQFLAESVLVCLSGGLIGIILGVGVAKLISLFTGISTIITFSSIIISFGIAVAVGIIFGYGPAKRASEKNPIESLRR